MSNPNDHVPAYPFPHFAQPDGTIELGFPGLSKRELFAAMAMHGFITSTRSHWAGYTIAEIAADATATADALLAELAKPREGT